MQDRGYNRDDLIKLLQSLSDPSTFLQALDGFPELCTALKTTANFTDDGLVYASLSFITDNIALLDSNRLAAAKRWLLRQTDSQDQRHSQNSPLIKSLTAITTAVEACSILNRENNALNIAADCSDCYLNLSGGRLSGITIDSKTMPYTNLTDGDIEGGHLRKLDLRHAKLLRLNAKNAMLDGVDWSDADIRDIQLKDATLTDITFFAINTLKDKLIFKTALDRWWGMMENHPQLSLLRKAMTEDVLEKRKLLSVFEQIEVDKIFYNHDVIARHQDASWARRPINGVHQFFSKNDGQITRAAVETRSQSQFFKGLAQSNGSNNF